MNISVDGFERVETKPTGQSIEGVFQDIIQELNSMINIVSNSEGRVATTTEGVARLSCIVREYNSDISVSFESTHGSQNRGFLIEIEVSGTSSVTPDEIEELGDTIRKAITNVVTIIET